MTPLKVTHPRSMEKENVFFYRKDPMAKQEPRRPVLTTDRVKTPWGHLPLEPNQYRLEHVSRDLNLRGKSWNDTPTWWRAAPHKLDLPF